jgi:hypothetical protein
MKAALLMSILAVALAGCFASRPHGNVGFGTPHALPELDGTYQNLGEGNPKEGSQYLSRTIWPSDQFLPHKAIRTISVRAIGDTALAVRALGVDQVAVKEATFISGKDFQFTGGRLRLATKVENTLHTPEAGGLFVARTTQELGLDKKGQGKYKKRETVVGAVYLVVPMAVTMSTEVRFVRLGEP